jgi:hypothetical protein
MHDLIDVLMDKTDQPWFNTSEKDQFLNLAYMEFVMQSHRFFENDEKRRQDVAPLVRRAKIDTASTHRTVMLSQLPNFLFILSMSGVFANDCGGKIITVDRAQHTPTDDGGSSYTDPHPLYEGVTSTQTTVTATDTYTDAQYVNIRPIQIDDFNSSLNDPFNKASDGFPVYVVRGDVKNDGYFEIYSDTAPKGVYVDYMKKPEQIDTLATPAGSIVLSEYTHEEVVNIAVRKMLENIESPQRYQTQRVEISERDN